MILDGVPLVHIDDDLVVVDKPAGLLAVPGRGPEKADCVLHRLQRHLGPLGVVHRLDMDTSGLIVLARTAAAQRTLSMAFAARRVHKRYVAVVAGIPLPPTAPDGWSD
ncbi:pseudouridine synthase, partial [Cutibacterium acnes]